MIPCILIASRTWLGTGILNCVQDNTIFAKMELWLAEIIGFVEVCCVGFFSPDSDVNYTKGKKTQKDK